MEKLYIGIDLHSASFQACAMTVDGTRQWEARFQRDAEGIGALCARCPPTSAVAVEATTPTWHFVDAVRPSVASVCVVDPLRTRLKAGYAAKTDRRDARRLADALRRDSVVSVYYPPPAIRELRELCRSRQVLVQTRTALVQRLRAILLRHGIREPRQRLTRPTGGAWLAQVAVPPEARAALTRIQCVLEVVQAQTAAADATLATTATVDPIVSALRTIPGIGPVIGLTVRSEIGDISRFATAPQLASYAGLVPRVERSAGHTWTGPITKRGSPWLRWALVEAALHGPRRADPTGRWARRLALRKGALKARVAVARTLCEEIWRVWPRVR
jgi:transposase